jgi:hypothetical protein
LHGAYSTAGGGAETHVRQVAQPWLQLLLRTLNCDTLTPLISQHAEWYAGTFNFHGIRADKLFAQSLKQLYPILPQTDDADEVVTYVEYIFTPHSIRSRLILCKHNCSSRSQSAKLIVARS